MVYILRLLIVVVMLNGCSFGTVKGKPRHIQCYARCDGCEVCELECDGVSEEADERTGRVSTR